MWKLTSSFISYFVILKKIYFYNLLTFITWRSRFVERRKVVCMHLNNSQFYWKTRKIRLCFCVWTRRIWLYLKFPNLLFPLKYHPTTLERQLNYLKQYATKSLWPSKDLSTMLCQQGFLLQFFLNLFWNLLVFLESTLTEK